MDFNFLQNGSETLCAPIDTSNFDVNELQYFTTVADCSATTDDFIPDFFHYTKSSK